MNEMKMKTRSPNTAQRVRMATQHRVLLYTTCYNVLDGVTLTVRKLEEEILAMGHSVCILTTVSGDPTNTDLVPEHPNRKVLFMDNSAPIPFVHDPNNPDLTYQIGFSISRSVLQEIEDFEPTIIHLTCPDCTALHLIALARRKEIPILGTYHSNIPEYMEHYPGMSWLKHILGAFFRHQYNFLQALYVPTPFIQSYLSQQYKMDKVTNLLVWGHGVDIDKFHPSNRSLKFRNDHGIYDDSTVVLLWVSRLVPEKRPDIFSNVVRRLAAMNLNFHALVVGAGPCEEEIKHLPNTTFCGWMNEDQLSVAYASSDVFLFPSSVETFGLVTLEAAASGLPVIVESNCSGHLVRNGESGFACPEANEEAFFQATLQLVTDHDKRHAFSQASRQLSLAWEKRAIIRRMLDNYSRITDEFYIEYGGHHANRDRQYQGKADSFVAGNHPRPLLLVIVEYIFISLFTAIFTMTHVFVYMQQAVLSRATGSTNGNWSLVPVDEENQQVAAAAVVVKEISLPPIYTTNTSNTTTAMVEEDELMIVELDDVDLELEYTSGGLGSAAINDDTESTGESTTASNYSAHEETTGNNSGSSSSSSSPSHASGASAPTTGRKISHVLAKCFVSSMQFQCRMESNVRNTCSSACCGTSVWKGRAKRKNSSVLVSGSVASSSANGGGAGGVPEMLSSRTRSDASEIMSGIMDENELLFAGHHQPSSERDRHCLRRNQSTPMIDV